MELCNGWYTCGHTIHSIQKREKVRKRSKDRYIECGEHAKLARDSAFVFSAILDAILATSPMLKSLIRLSRDTGPTCNRDTAALASFPCAMIEWWRLHTIHDQTFRTAWLKSIALGFIALDTMNYLHPHLLLSCRLHRAMIYAQQFISVATISSLHQ